MTTPERQLEDQFIEKLQGLKYQYRADIRDRAALEKNFRDKFEALNHVHLTDGEFKRLLDEIVTPDVFTAAHTLRNRSSFTRDDGTPLNYTLVNIVDWCKNTFEVVSQLRINTDSSHHRYGVLLLINGIPVAQIELKTLGINPRRAIEQIVEYKNDPGNGYVWHTTGSGKTLTSFKASTLLKANPTVDKCIFVVDRKDLDRQTREEFNRFQEGCVEENTNTETLVRRLLSDDAADKVIVTTIQKLGRALDPARSDYRQRLQSLRNQRIVFIFDECHRSQFGENHQAIKEFFPRAQLFGFIGTPIFEENASYKRIEGDVQTLKTTQDLFQKELHAYTITHAIEDRNVLRFQVDYYKPEGVTVEAEGASPPVSSNRPNPNRTARAVPLQHSTTRGYDDHDGRSSRLFYDVDLLRHLVTR